LLRYNVRVISDFEGALVSDISTTSATVDLPPFQLGRTYTVRIYSISNNVRSNPPTALSITPSKIRRRMTPFR